MPSGIQEDLGQRHCDNCHTRYKLKQKVREGERGFCTPNCRKEFHKHGGSYAKLKPVITQEVRKRIKELRPMDGEWQTNIETRIQKLERLFHEIGEAFSFRRSA